MGNLSTPDSVQKLQTALHAKAKAEPGYRFYALCDKISREDILAHAYTHSCRARLSGTAAPWRRILKWTPFLGPGVKLESGRSV